jgi:hypothetical protein
MARNLFLEHEIHHYIGLMKSKIVGQEASLKKYCTFVHKTLIKYFYANKTQ